MLWPALGFGHALETLHADFDPFLRAIDDGLDRTKVGIKDTEIDIVGMGNSIARHGMLPANFTRFRHSILQ
jgi:hypothetical protein